MAAGEFDDILDAKAERTSRRVSVPVDADDEFDDVLNARAERQHRYISTLIEAAVKDNPGAAAERDRLSRSTGLPPDVVARNQQELKRKEMVRAIDLDLNRMMRDSPILYRHFADPSFASMAIDDVGPLTRLGRTILSVPADITAQGLGLPELALKTGGEFLDWGAGNQPHANPLRDAGEWLGTIRQGQQALAEELRGDQSGAGFFEQGVLGGVSSFVQMLPGMLGTIATGNPAFALWAAGLQSGSTTAADAMDSGLPAWRSGLVGMTDGMIEAITEMAPAFKFVESMKVGDSFARFFGKQLMTELPGELLATLGQEYNAWAAGLRGDADLGEWVRTLPEAQAQTVIATLTMVALTSGLGRGAVRLLQDRKAAEEAPQKAERLRELFELSSASALRQRAPETFAEFVDQAAADGQQTLYLDAEALAQSVRQMPPEELERALPGAAEQLARGERWVSVPLGAAMAGVPGTALEDLIVQHSKLDPEGLTLTEASAATEQADSLIATEIDRIQQEATDQAVVIEQIDRVRGVIEEQIVASGRHSPDVAAVQAEWLARAYTVLADAEGMTPDQLWAERPLIIRAQQGMAASNGVNAGDKLTQNTGPFGQVFTEYRGDAQGAIARLTQEQSGDATAALSHPEIGDIDLVWGKAGTNRHDGYGLAKLVRWHPEVLSDLQGLIGSMRVTQRSENRVHLESEDHEASVRLQWDGQSKHWLLTAYQKRGSDTGTRTDIAGADVADDSPPTASEAIVEQDMQQFYQAQAAFDGPDVRFSFVGQRAATADAHALATAQERLDAGEDAESVRRDTGWFKGEDGKWRFEINDKDAKLIGLRDDGDGKAHRNSDLGEVLDHPALFAAYPALRNVWVQIEVDQSFLDESGAYTLARPADENTVARAAQIDVKARTESEALSVLLHEVQHDIQTIEGFAKGGSASDQSLPTFLEMGKAINEDATRRQEEVRNSPEYAEFVRNFIEGYEGPQYVDRRGRQVDAAQLAADEAAYQRFIAPIEEDRLQRIDGLGDSYGIDTRYAAYRLLAGEVEARNTQSRRGLTDEQRRTTPPSTTADAASRDVIVIFNGKVAHSAPPPVNAAQSVDNGASQGDGNAQRGRRTYDNGIPQGLPAERTADSDALERIIDAEQRRAGLPEGFQAVAVRQDQLPDALRGALAGLERATGTRVVIFRALTPEIADFNGVTIRDGVLYVSETAQSPATSTAAHEWVHNLRKTNPDLYARLENEVRRQGDAYGFAAKYGYTMGQAHEELTAAAVGDALTDPKFLERLAEHDAGLFTKMARAFLKFLKGFADGWRNQGSDAFLQDVQAFHDVLEEVLHAYERAKPKERAQAGFVKSVFARFQRVWHGTPHRGIETTGFKLNKIGSGEGAQAYGWGMYFASQREIAEHYRKTLQQRMGYTLRGKKADELSEAEALVLRDIERKLRASDWSEDSIIRLARSEARAEVDRAERALSEARQQVGKQLDAGAGWGELRYSVGTESDVADAEARLALAKRRLEIADGIKPGDVAKPVGQLYEVEIPEDSEMLLWDKPLSEQPEKVRQIIRQHKLPMYDERDYDAIQLADGSWSIYRIDPDTREAAQVARLDREDARNAQEALAMSGAQFDAGRFLYEKIARDKNGPRGASEYLNSIGIPGLRYLDGNSRGQGEGSHNYVIWDEALLTPENADIQALYQRGKVVRAAFNPSEFAITLGPDTNLTSLHHESAHAFLELLHYLAARDGASERSRGMMDAALKWMGIAGDTPEERLAAWGAMSLNEKRAGHEQFAEGYEAYLFEGKAPTPELQRLMGRFRAWMKQAYGSLKQFFAGKGWQLDPEIRAVYDRILATDAEIRSAEERAGLVPDDAATTAAIEKLTAQSLRDLRWAREARNKTLRALQREAASKRKAVREEVAAEVMASPLEQVRKILRTTKEEDVNTPALMDALGVSSPEELARVLTLAPSAAEMIEAGTDRRMLERYGELTDPEALAAAADAAVHNEARARALAAELRAQDEVMGERADTGRRNARGARITENVVLEAGKRFADSIVRSTPVGELKAKRQLYLAAERKAARAQRAATAAGKTADAIAAQKDQLLNHLVAKGLMDAVDEADAAREEFKEYVKAGMKAQVTKGRDPAIVSMLRVIMGQYGIIERQAEKARDYLQMVQAFDPITSQRLEAIIAQAEQNAKPYKALTVDELQALRDLLGSIWEIAKTSRMMEVDGKQMRREDAAKMLLARMEEKGIPKVIPGEYGAITPGEERVLGLKGAMAWLVRVEQWTQAMDGKWGGPFTRLIFQPIKEAADRYRADRLVYLKKYEALIKQIEPYLHADPIVAHELGGYTFSGHTALLHALLHTGNESNKRKLLLGRQWASLREDGTMDTSKWDAFLQRMHDSGVITKAHWDFVQGVWDLLEETKPLAQATHRRVFGRFFDEVAADPVTTPFGTYRGGYVPAQADARQTPDAAVRALVEDQNASMINAFPEPARGFTKGRVEYNAPLLLDLGALRQHIDKVLLFAHMEGPVTDVTKLLTDKEVSNALFRISPHAYDTILLPWLKTASRQTVETPIAGDRGVHRLVTWMRSRSGMALMFANVSNTLQQVTGFVTALNKVKASSLRRAAARYIAHPADMTEVIKAKSIFMRNRIESEVSAINASMEKILINAGVFARAEMWTQEHAYFMQSAVDNVMGPIVWSAAYDEASARGESEKDAIRWADSVIRTTQGSQLPEDVARFETGNPWARLFSQFAGYFGMLANTSASELVNIHEQGLGLVRGAGKALMIGLYGVALPVWIAEAIAIAMRGGPEDDDDDGYLDDWMAAVFGWGSIRGATAMIPYAGQAVLGIATRLNDNPVDDKLSLSPAISLIESTVGVPANVYRAIIGKGTWAAAARSAAGGATLLTGLPIYAVARPISYTLGMAEGRIEPQGPWDATRGLITGTPSPESKQRP